MAGGKMALQFRLCPVQSLQSRHPLPPRRHLRGRLPSRIQFSSSSPSSRNHTDSLSTLRKAIRGVAQSFTR